MKCPVIHEKKVKVVEYSNHIDTKTILLPLTLLTLKITQSWKEKAKRGKAKVLCLDHMQKSSASSLKDNLSCRCRQLWYYVCRHIKNLYKVKNFAKN